MDYNGVLWILQNPVNGFEDTSMDYYGVFSGRRPDTQKRELRKASIYKAFKDLIKQFATILQQNRD